MVQFPLSLLFIYLFYNEERTLRMNEQLPSTFLWDLSESKEQKHSNMIPIHLCYHPVVESIWKAADISKGLTGAGMS